MLVVKKEKKIYALTLQTEEDILQTALPASFCGNLGLKQSE